jgi:hypothetical protein
MCMFCAALPMVIGATAVAQGEQRKKLRALESPKQTQTVDAPKIIISQDRSSAQVERRSFAPRLSPMRINQLGALAFVGLLVASGFYHTHMPG